jgi:hypothetical protein
MSRAPRDAPDGRVRDASFVGRRKDKDPTEVVHDTEPRHRPHPIPRNPSVNGTELTARYRGPGRAQTLYGHQIDRLWESARRRDLVISQMPSWAGQLHQLHSSPLPLRYIPSHAEVRPE